MIIILYGRAGVNTDIPREGAHTSLMAAENIGSRGAARTRRICSLLAAGILALLCISCCMPDIPATAHAETPEITLIAHFATYYGDSSEGRKHNIALAASAIDGVVLAQEEEFSFNDIVGARTEERGYRAAYVIQDGVFVEGVGGGVCQVSGTLYNCALLADLTVTCARPHSLPVSYLAPSFDAMVSSESDLRFVNTLSAPVTVKMTADGSYLRAEMYGVKGEFSVRRRSETVGEIPFETEHLADPSLPPGEERVESPGKNGLRSEGWLEYFRDGTLVRSLRIRRDTYLPQKRIICEGVTPSRSLWGYYSPTPPHCCRT